MSVHDPLCLVYGVGYEASRYCRCEALRARDEQTRADERRAVRRAIVDNYGPESGPVNLSAVLRIIGGDDA